MLTTAVRQQTVVGMNAWVIHNDKSIWGDDVHKFRPERWLGEKQQVAHLEQHFLAASLSGPS